MSKTDRTIILVGAGVLAALWLLRRIVATRAADDANDNEVPMLPQIGSVVPMPKNNSLSTCDCPAAKTTVLDFGDYSQGGYTQPRLGVAPIPPSIGGALPS